MANYPEDPWIRNVYQLLVIGRHHSDEMIDLRKRLRDIDCGIRLTESALIPGLENGSSLMGTGFRYQRVAPSAQTLLRLYQQKREQVDRRMAFIERENALLAELLSELDEMERRVVAMRWMEKKSWKQVSMKLYLSTRSGQRIQSRAVLKMARRLQAKRASGQAEEGSIFTDTDN